MTHKNSMLGCISICFCLCWPVLFTLKEIFSFISIVALKSEVTCPCTYFAELQIPRVNLFVFAFVFMKFCLGLLSPLRSGVGWNFCVCCCKKIVWSAYYRLPLLFFILEYIASYSTGLWSLCKVWSFSFISHRA